MGRLKLAVGWLAVLIFANSFTTNNSILAQSTSFTISGKVTQPPSGSGPGIPAATVVLTLNSSSQTMVQTDAGGNFSFPPVPQGSNYDVAVTKPGYTFNPASQGGTNIQFDRTLFFTGAATGATFQFSQTEYTVNESSPSVTLTVTRTGDTSAAASVFYQTADTDNFTVACSDTTNNHGGAFARCDFATTLDTLTFAAGDASKSFTVPIINDSFAEGDETFTVVLSNAQGASLGSPSTATVRIIDNDTVTGPNPIFTTPFFVRQHYLDFLSREPEAGEPWSGVLNNCSDVNNNPSCDRLTVSGAFFGSPEFQLKGYFVYRFYKVAFNRLPLYTEIVADMRAVTGQTSSEVFQKKGAFTNAFVLRTEFTNGFGPMTNAAYVAALMSRYSLTQITTFDPANPDGTNKVTLSTTDLTNQLNAGTLTRAQVLRAIADSDQVASLEFNKAFVAMQYYGYLRRTPEQSGFDSWLNYLNTHPGDSRTMVNGFMNSPEYRMRFGPAQ